MCKRINTGRQFEIDCIKVFAIVYMVCIHVYEELSSVNCEIMPNTIYRNLMEFLGGPLAAPVFMFAMGIGMVYTRHNTPQNFIRRGWHLLVGGYLLSLARSGLVFGILELMGSENGSWANLLTVDILQFAGMAFLTIGILRKLKISDYMSLLFAFLIQSIGIWGRNLVIPSEPLALIVGLFLPTHSWVSFPMTLWLVYPMLGICFANILQTVTDKREFYKKILIVSSVGLMTLTLTFLWNGFDIRSMYALADNQYYDQTTFTTLWTLAVVLIAISVCYFLLSKMEYTKIGTFIKFGSRNLNIIFIIQWIVIAEVWWFQPNLSIEWIIPVGSIILVVSFWGAFVYENRKKRN